MMSDSRELCPICGEGHLQTQVGKNSVEYKGQTADLDLHYSLCDACGSEQSNAGQLRANKRTMVAFKKQVDGLLTGAEVRALREKLGLNQTEAARAFGGGPVAFSKYESDDVAQSEAMDKLLRLAAELPVAFEMLARRAGLTPVAADVSWQEAMGWRADFAVEQRAKRPTLRLVHSSTPGKGQEKRYGTYD